MELPFSHDAFLDVFGEYNSLLWPAVLVLWVVTARMIWGWLWSGAASGRALFALLAVHWAWSGIAYHWFFFRDVNPAATLFSGLFVLQAVFFAWLALCSRAPATASAGLRGVIGTAFVLYGLIYPVVGLAFGLEYPRLPLFAVPCPTTFLTAGLLIAVVGAPRFVALVPILWAVVGSSAAFALGIRADLALVVAGAALAIDMLAPSAFGRRAAA